MSLLENIIKKEGAGISPCTFPISIPFDIVYLNVKCYTIL